MGQRFDRDYTPETIAKSDGQFERAVALHPPYALAHAALAQSHEMLALRRDERGPEIEQALALARKSIDLDPDLAEGHLRLATIRFFWDWDWSQCEGGIKGARDLDPTSVNAHFSYAVCLGLLGRFEEAVGEYERWRLLDPLSPADPWMAVVPLQRLGRLTEAIDTVRLVISLDPEDPFNPGYGSRASILAELLMAAHRDGEALPVLVEWSRARDKAPELAPRLEAAFARGPAEFRVEVGRQERARFERYLRQLQAGGGDLRASAVELARIHAGLGDLDRAFGFLEVAFQQKLPQLAVLKTTPTFAPLRADPRYHALLRKMNLPPDS